jgi:hypothetical protein
MHVAPPVLVLAEGSAVAGLVAAAARLSRTSPTVPATLGEIRLLTLHTSSSLLVVLLPSAISLLPLSLD